MELQSVPIDQIEDVPAPESKVRQLSLMELEQVYPVKLRTNGTGTYEIVDGRRRIADLKAIGAETVWAVVEEMDDVTAAAHSLTANVSRSRNHMSEAWDAARLRDAGYSQTRIAEQVGVSQGFISQLLALADSLHPDLQQKLAQGEIAFSCARIALKLPVKDQVRLAQMDRPTIKAAKELLESYQSKTIDLSDLDVPGSPNDYTPPAVIPADDMDRLAKGETIIIEWQGLTLTVSANT